MMEGALGGVAMTPTTPTVAFSQNSCVSQYDITTSKTPNTHIVEEYQYSRIKMESQVIKRIRE